MFSLLVLFTLFSFFTMYCMLCLFVCLIRLICLFGTVCFFSLFALFVLFCVFCWCVVYLCLPMLVCMFNLCDITCASLYTPAIPGHLDRILLLRSAQVCMNLIFLPSHIIQKVLFFSCALVLHPCFFYYV